MESLLVTGGAGFIGSNIVDAYLERGHEVPIFDDLYTGQRANLNAKAAAPMALPRARAIASTARSAYSAVWDSTGHLPMNEEILLEYNRIFSS